jgi:hypothetical protein
MHSADEHAARQSMVVHRGVAIIACCFCVLAAFLAAASNEMLRYHQNTEDLLAKRLVERSHIMTEQDKRLIAESNVIMDAEDRKLLRIRNYAMSAAAFFAFLSVLVYVKTRGRMQRFVGLTALVASCATFIAFWLGISSLGESFYGGNNALMDLRMTLFFMTLSCLPMLFFVSGKINQREVQQGLHSLKWISYMAFTLATLLLIVGIVVLLALLMTPDLGGHWG